MIHVDGDAAYNIVDKTLFSLVQVKAKKVKKSACYDFFAVLKNTSNYSTLPEAFLMLSKIERAILDAFSSIETKYRKSALLYLASDLFDCDLISLGITPGYARRKIKELLLSTIKDKSVVGYS